MTCLHFGTRDLDGAIGLQDSGATVNYQCRADRLAIC
jgi:hypothetical protein